MSRAGSGKGSHVFRYPEAIADVKGGVVEGVGAVRCEGTIPERLGLRLLAVLGKVKPWEDDAPPTFNLVPEEGAVAAVLDGYEFAFVKNSGLSSSKPSNWGLDAAAGSKKPGFPKNTIVIWMIWSPFCGDEIETTVDSHGIDFRGKLMR